MNQKGQLEAIDGMIYVFISIIIFAVLMVSLWTIVGNFMSLLVGYENYAMMDLMVSFIPLLVLLGIVMTFLLSLRGRRPTTE